MRIAQHTQPYGALDAQALADLAVVAPQVVLVFGPVEQFERSDLTASLSAAFPGAALAPGGE